MSTNLVAAYTPGADRNNFSGFLGMRFVLSSDWSVTSLGMRKATGNTGSQTVYLLNAALATIASASINLTSASVGTFVYAAITPVGLTSGSTYYLICQATSGGQFWSDIGNTTLNAAGSVQSTWTSGTLSGGYNVQSSGQQYFGLDFIGDLTTLALPGAGALTFTGLAPTNTGSFVTSTAARFTQLGSEVWVSNTPAVVISQIGSEAWVSMAPAAVVSQLGVEVWRSVTDGATPGAGAIRFTGLAPLSSSDTPVPSGAIAFSGFAPSNDGSVTPATGSIVFTGHAPTTAIDVEPAAGGMIFTGFAPMPVALAGGANFFFRGVF